MQDIAPLLVWPFAASVALIGIHAYLGLHVLRRGIVFADLALAQISALGATVAFAAGYAPASSAGFAYTLAFTAFGAALLTASRRFARVINQEAFIGVLYVAATAATILVVDRSPQGAEHVKKILIGSLLAVESDQVIEIVLLYGLIAVLLYALRRPFFHLSETYGDAGRPAWQVAVLDLLFYLAFGVVVTSSVAIAGVLLVFCFLIVPAVIGMMFTQRTGPALAIGWSTGIAASVLGLCGSFEFDAPTGAAMVLAFVFVLALAGAARALVFTGAETRRRRWVATGSGAAIAGTLVLLASGVWLIVAPKADQPLLALVEATTGLGPEPFLTQDERDTYRDAAASAERFKGEVERLNARERSSRWQGTRLSDDEVRRLGSYQQSFNEMARGELFVMDVLRGHARERQRWYIGLPLAVVAAALLALALRPDRGR
jgi:zinc/manganese transport system permease protein